MEIGVKVGSDGVGDVGTQELRSQKPRNSHDAELEAKTFNFEVLAQEASRPSTITATLTPRKELPIFAH